MGVFDYILLFLQKKRLLLQRTLFEIKNKRNNMSKTSIAKKTVVVLGCVLDIVQLASSIAIAANALGGEFKNYSSGIAWEAFAWANEGERLGAFSGFVGGLNWTAFKNIWSGQPSAEGFVMLGQEHDVQQLTTPEKAFQLLWCTGAGGILELYTTGTHLSLSIPAALLLSGELTPKTVTLPFITLGLVDVVLYCSNKLLEDHHPELSH